MRQFSNSKSGATSWSFEARFSLLLSRPDKGRGFTYDQQNYWNLIDGLLFSPADPIGFLFMKHQLDHLQTGFFALLHSAHIVFHYNKSLVADF